MAWTLCLNPVRTHRAAIFVGIKDLVRAIQSRPTIAELFLENAKLRKAPGGNAASPAGPVNNLIISANKIGYNLNDNGELVKGEVRTPSLIKTPDGLRPTSKSKSTTPSPSSSLRGVPLTTPTMNLPKPSAGISKGSPSALTGPLPMPSKIGNRPETPKKDPSPKNQ